MRALRTLILGGCVALLAGCGDAAPAVEDHPPTPWPVTQFPELPPEMRDIPEARPVLGEILFFDPILSVDGETACGTCHSEFWGMSDGLVVSIGHGAGPLGGPGRDGPNVLRRNAQALWNLAFRESLFWDGRTETLEEQAIEPLLAQDELARDPVEAVTDIAQIPEYAAMFVEAFPDDPRVTVDNLASALSAFQRTLVSDKSLYDGYVEGDAAALSPKMVDGMFRFADFGCDGCHTPPLFESEGFFDRNVPRMEGIDDAGRFEVTGNESDRDRFRVPTLRNIAFTEAYFHNGAMFLLPDAVRHELEQSGLAYDEEDVDVITAFVSQALRDEHNEPERPRAVPSGLQVPIDGTVIDREQF